jgi:hypothetical protein
MRSFLLAAGLLCGAAVLRADEPPASFSGMIGVGASMSDASEAIPIIRMEFNAPVAFGDEDVARLDVAVALMGLPGDEVDINKPKTWKSAEVHGELQRRIGSDYHGSSTYLVGRAGFHTRIIPSDPAPRDRYARSYGVGVRVERRDEDHSIRRTIAVLYGRSDVANPHWDKGQIIVEGSARIAGVAGVEVIVGGDAYLNVSRTQGRGVRDVARVWVGASWGK